MLEVSTWPSHMLTSLHVFQKEGNLCDVTIETAQRETLSAHSLVLAAGMLFWSIFIGIILTHVKYFVSMIYTKYVK